MKSWLVHKNLIMLEDIKRVSLTGDNDTIEIAYKDGERWAYTSKSGRLEKEFDDLVRYLSATRPL